MTKPPSAVAQLNTEATDKLAEVNTPQELEAWRVTYLGRKGAVPQLLRGVKDLPEDEKKEAGQAANQLRQELETAYKKKKQEVSNEEDSEKKLEIGNWKLEIDGQGHLHPITLTIRRIEQILIAMGFTIVSGPEVEEEYYDFDALNIPFTHPARTESDSFYIHPRRENGRGLVLRTSTSAVQVRSVLEQNLVPPFKIASPGRVFRNEKPDATHESMFHQIEALAVGPNITIADYKGVTETLFSTFFGSNVNIRLRPGYFPFVEPGFEVDMSCVFCRAEARSPEALAKGDNSKLPICKICKGSKWIEMGGAGMVHPNVLKNMNIDAEKFQGFAFGYGLDRFTMLQRGVTDIRLFWSGNIRFLRQFS